MTASVATAAVREHDIIQKKGVPIYQDLKE